MLHVELGADDGVVGGFLGVAGSEVDPGFHRLGRSLRGSGFSHRLCTVILLPDWIMFQFGLLRLGLGAKMPDRVKHFAIVGGTVPVE